MRGRSLRSAIDRSASEAARQRRLRAQPAANVCKQITTSQPKVIWEEGRVAALSHTYAVKSPLVTMARSKFPPSPGPIPKPHYMPHPWTRPTYGAKRHADPIRRLSTMHWTDRPTGRPTDRSRESLMTRPLRYESDAA